jgi:hypothetical protein
LVAPQNLVVVPGELKFSASYDQIPVTVSRLRYEYRIDAGSPVSNGTNLTLTDIVATAGFHTLGIRSVSTSGVAGPWNTSAAFEVTAPPVTEILDWPMQEGSGTAINSTAGPDGTAHSITWAVGPGGSGASIDFNGTSSYAQSDSSVVYGVTAITVEAMIYVDSWASGTANFIWESGPDYAAGPCRFAIYFQSGLVGAFLAQDGAAAQATFTAGAEGLADATWYNIKVVYNNDANAGAGEIKIFIDDTQITTSDFSVKTGTGNIATETLNIGARNGASFWFGGRMANLVIYEGDIT